MTHRPWKVFVSYSRKDEEIVQSFAEALKGAGIEIWLDKWSILPGERVSSALENGISGSDFLLLMLSADALKSGWVDREWRSKYQTEVDSDETKVIVVRIEECEIPLFLKDKLYIDCWFMNLQELALQLAEKLTMIKDKEGDKRFDGVMNMIIESIKDGTANTKFNFPIEETNRRLMAVLNSISSKDIEVEVCRALLVAEVSALRLNVDENYKALMKDICELEQKKANSPPERTNEIFHMWLSMSLKILERERLYVLRLERKITEGLPLLTSVSQIASFLEHIFEHKS